MSKFSDKIQEIIEESGYTVYQIARGSGLGRTSIHKMMAGTLMPGRKFMNEFYQYMRVLPSEKQELEYLYMIEKDGPEKYENRKFIKEMLEGIAGYYKPNKSLEKDFRFSIVWNKKTEHGYNQFKTLELIHMVLNEELESHSEPAVAINIPIVSKSIFDLLYQFCEYSEKTLKVRQLVIMNQNPHKLKDANYNLKILHRILPLALSFPSFYEVHRCYSRCEESDSYAFFWPYYMITHDYVVMISNDGTSAYVQKDKGIVERYRAEFDKLYDDSDVFLEQYQDPVVAFQYYLKNYEKYGMPTYTLESKPCLAHMFLEGTLERLMGEMAEQIPELYTTLLEFYTKPYEKENIPVGFFSQDGLEDFYHRGRIFEQTGLFVNGIEKNVRKQMLEEFLRRSREFAIKSHMILDKKMKIPPSLMLEVFGGRKLLLFNSRQPMYLNFIQINESSICEAFYDFMEYLGDSDFTLTEDETLEYIGRMI